MKLFRISAAFLLAAFFIASCTKLEDSIADGLIEIRDVQVAMNPSGLAPLTAQLSFNTLSDTKVRIVIPGNDPVRKSFETLATDHEIPVLGLYPGQVNYVVVEAYNDENSVQKIVEIETPELPEFMPNILIKKQNASAMEQGWNMLNYNVGLGAPNFFTAPFAFDKDGIIRWYIDLRGVDPTFNLGPWERMSNGNFLSGNGRNIYEYDVMGNEVNTWTMPANYSYHHDVIQKPNGNFIIAVDDSNLDTIEDIAIELDVNTSEVLNRWDLREILDIDRFALINDPNDWFHMNAIWYDERDNTVIFSGQRQGLVKVSEDNELIWILAPHNDWGKAGLDGNGQETSDFLLTAVDGSGTPYDHQVQMGEIAIDEFEWSWGQHAPMILKNGNLFAYDNGFRRNYGAPRGTYARGVEYKIDESNMTIRQIWQSGKEKGATFQSHIISDVDELEQTGNRLIFSGINTVERKSHFIEVVPSTSEVVFEAEVFYKLAFIEPGAPLAPGNLDASYRMERVSIYSGY